MMTLVIKIMIEPSEFFRKLEKVNNFFGTESGDLGVCVFQENFAQCDLIELMTKVICL
jgi:hypothetical protein